MALRMHVLAAREAEPARAQPRLQMEVWPLGDWTWGLASVWALGQHEASWRLALLSRERRCLTCRATTVDDAFVDFEAFWNGEPVAHVVHDYGGLLGQGGDGDADRDQPPGADRLAELEAGEEWDSEVVAAAAEGRPFREAARAVASRRAEQLASELARAGAASDRAWLEAVLLGRRSEAEGEGEDDVLYAWGDVPELLEAAGLPGFREALRSRVERQEAESAGVATEEPAETLDPSVSPRPRLKRMFGCAVVLALSLAGSVVGFREGGLLGAFGGLTIGGLLLAALAAFRLWRGTRVLRKALAGARQGSPPAPRVPGPARTLLGRWRAVGARVGEPVPGGLFGALYPSAAPPTDAAGRGLVKIAADPQRGQEAERRITRLWLSLLDAELAGRTLGPLRREHRELGEWLARQAG